MRIGLAPNQIPMDIDYSFHRGEWRWLVNWVHILKKAGHEIVEANDGPDIILNTLWYGNVGYLDRPHVHLRFGAFTQGCLKHLDCFGPNCYVAAPYKESFEKSDPELREHVVFMPTPYDKAWLPAERLPPTRRKEITWAAKEVWSDRVKESTPHIRHCGIWVIESLADLAQEHNFKLNLVQCHETGSHFQHAPPEVHRALERIPKVNKTNNSLTFLKILEMLSRSRISLPIGGMAASTLEAIFAGCTPMAHEGICLGGLADEQDLNMPLPRHTTKEHVQEHLFKMFTDDDFYNQLYACYQEELQPHLEENAIVLFREAFE
jgi:hypothetical protein